MFDHHFFLIKCMSSSHVFSVKDKLLVRVIQPQERQQILDFIRLHYYLEEPLTAGSEPKQQDKEDEDWSMSHIEHGLSLMAILYDNTNFQSKLAGVVISGSKGPHEAKQMFEEASRLGPTKLGHILQFSACVERDANVYERFNVQKVLHIHVLAVDNGQRGRNIGRHLIEELLCQAKRFNYEMVTVDCTSFYSARIFERMGFQCINIKFYKDYVDGTGKQVFTPAAPHECVKTFALQLNRT